jgi:bifunctional non-homologous end joining protein LigD
MRKSTGSKPVARSSADGALAEYRRKRDFTKTAEPQGGPAATRAKHKLAFVIQKHAARQLHFDLRLELDGTMKSWAVPKGPSVDPSDKRLAMQVEDHPIEYNTFEGIIPEGEYGGGSVMLWDRGWYTHPDKTADPLEKLRAGYAKGDFKFELHGKRLCGSWVLVRLRRGDPEKPAWLLIKHRDDCARPGYDIVAAEQTSVRTRRTMEQIAKGRSRVWNSNRS